jgi:hypothetical protein
MEFLDGGSGDWKSLGYATLVHDVAELQQHVENACKTIRWTGIF